MRVRCLARGGGRDDDNDDGADDCIGSYDYAVEASNRLVFSGGVVVVSVSA